jgi:hypothetical protein
MTVIPGMNRMIKDALVTILTGLTYGGETAFANVTDNTHNDFEGSPIARVLPGGYQSVTGSNVQRDHTVSYSIILSWPLENPSDVEADLYNQMYDLTDLIVDTLQHDDYIQKLSTINPLITNWLLDANRATWRIAAGKIGALLLCEINVMVSYSKDIQ